MTESGSRCGSEVVEGSIMTDGEKRFRFVFGRGEVMRIGMMGMV